MNIFFKMYGKEISQNELPNSFKILIRVDLEILNHNANLYKWVYYNKSIVVNIKF